MEGRILFWWKTLVEESIGNAPPDDCPEPELGALNRLVVYTTDWWVDDMLPVLIHAVLRTALMTVRQPEQSCSSVPLLLTCYRFRMPACLQVCTRAQTRGMHEDMRPCLVMVGMWHA